MDPKPTSQGDAPRAEPPRPASGRRRWWPRTRARLRTVQRRILALIGPFVVTGLLIWVLGMIFGSSVSWQLLGLSIASILWFGSTVIFSAALIGEGALFGWEIPITLNTWEIALWVMYLNTAAAFFYAFNIDLLEKLPWVGPYLRRARSNAATILEEHKWIRRTAEFGVGLFVMTPLPGSGQLGGCFVARVIGLSKRTTFLVVTFAGIVVAALYASGGSYVKRFFDDREIQTWVRVLIWAAFLAMAWLLFKMLRYLGREEKPAADPSGGDPASPGQPTADAEPERDGDQVS